MNIGEIVLKLNGPIMPVGETNTDDERFDNLESLCDLTDFLILEINKVACRTHSNEFSIKRNVDFAKKWMDKTTL